MIKLISVLNSFRQVELLGTKMSKYTKSSLMRIHLVRYSTSARYEKYSNTHLVRPIIRLV